MSSEPSTTVLPVVPFPAEADGAPLLPAATTDGLPHREALAEGVLALQACARCDRMRYPVAPVCPWCRVPEHEWRAITGAGTVRSWVRYHRAFAQVFADQAPYVVVSVDLDAGPGMVGRLRGDVEPEVGLRVSAVLERWADDARVPAFVPASTDGAA